MHTIHVRVDYASRLVHLTTDIGTEEEQNMTFLLDLLPDAMRQIREELEEA